MPVKLEGPVFVLKWGSLLSDYRGGSSVLVEDEVENLYVTVEGSLERNSLRFIRITWSELSSCFRGSRTGLLISF